VIALRVFSDRNARNRLCISQNRVREKSDFTLSLRRFRSAALMV
jgi:hypothetical protein